jgi:molybdate transport system substrate-binding protein
MPRRAALALACLAALAVLSPSRAQVRTVTVFAAASLRNAIDDANRAFAKASGIKVVVSYAGTSALVKQIEAGAPADVLLSADLRWMEYLAQNRLIDPRTRVNLLGNRLVLIAPKDSRLDRVAITPGFDIARHAGDGRIAIANVTAVPAGRYAKAALQALGVWAAAENKLAQAENVRAALAYVSRGEAPLGIVYATDARIDIGVKVIGTFPDGSHPPIAYPVAATADAKPEAARYLAFLRTSSAKGIFEAYGFSFLIRPTS